MLNNVSMIYKDLADYDRAIRLCKRCLEIRERDLGRESPVVAESLNNLATIYEQQARYSQALPLLTRSAGIMEKHYGLNHPKFALALNNLGDLYRDLGDGDRAASFCKQGLVIREKALDAKHPAIAESLDSLGWIQLSAGNFKIALDLFTASFEIRKGTFGEFHPVLADSINGAASAYSGLGEFEKASDALRVALDITEKVHGTNHIKVARCLNGLAGAYHHLGKDRLSLPLYRRALDIFQTAYGLRHPNTIDVLENIAFTLESQGETEAAINWFSEALRNQKAYFSGQFAYAPDDMALQGIANSFSSEETFHSLCGSAVGMNLPVSASLGAEQLAFGKASLEEVRAVQAALESDAHTETQELRTQWRAVQIQLDRLPESKIDPGERVIRRLQLQGEMAKLETSITERTELAVLRVQERDLKLAHVAHNLPTQSALIDFIQFDRYDFGGQANHWKEKRYAAYLTFPLARDSTNVIVERVDLGEAAPIDDAVQSVCKWMTSGQYEAKDLPAALQRLNELVYLTLARHLTNASHLIICPDGQLSRLPFEMLSYQGRFLVETKTISYVGSGREIVRLAQPPVRTNTSPPLVMGDPDFDFDLLTGVKMRLPSINTQRSTRKPLSATEVASASTKSLSSDYRGIRFTRLPGSKEEAQAVAELLGGDCALHLGKAARECDLKAVVSPRVLHLATHGFFLSDQDFKRTNSLRASWQGNFGTQRDASPPGNDWENPMVRCGIALAGANHANQVTNAVAEDGLLTGLEASLLNLQGTELVILSACDSGSGDIKIGEGVMSLRRAFRIAGAQTVLASHWKVSDKATSQLMTEFIRRWRSGEPRAQAWREVQLSLLHSKDFSSPYFWAAFTLAGQWR